MTVNQIAINLLSYFSPEERTIPDASAYPGRNAAVLVAINGALQELCVDGMPWVSRQNLGAVLQPPTTTTVDVVAGSTAIDIADYAAWMDGCAIAIEGETVDNRITNAGNPNFLQIPSQVTGTLNATVYHTSFELPGVCMSLISPVLVGGVEIDDFQKIKDFSINERCRSVVGKVKYYRVSSARVLPTQAPVIRLEIWPPPAVATPLQYTATLAHAVITNLASTNNLAIPFNFIQSVFLPIAARNLMDSSFFRGNAIPDTVLASEKKARMMLAKLVPNKTNSPRLIPIG
jgi:hypothetical protein